LSGFRAGRTRRRTQHEQHDRHRQPPAAEPAPATAGAGRSPGSTSRTPLKEVTTLQLTALLDNLAVEVDQPSVLADAPCQVYDAELWFAESPADVEHAKSLCQACPVRTACLAGALERHEPWGVWGGELFVAGVVVPRKRPRGRPRKTEIAA
jgi:WhiB family transcriptional regulator, redox-sensing transcriptional regulator